MACGRPISDMYLKWSIAQFATKCGFCAFSTSSEEPWTDRHSDRQTERQADGRTEGHRKKQARSAMRSIIRMAAYKIT